MTAVLDCVAPSNMGDVARRVVEVENLVGFVVAAAGVVLEQNRSQKDCEGGKTDSAVLVWCCLNSIEILFKGFMHSVDF